MPAKSVIDETAFSDRIFSIYSGKCSLCINIGASAPDTHKRTIAFEPVFADPGADGINLQKVRVYHPGPESVIQADRLISDIKKQRPGSIALRIDVPRAGSGMLKYLAGAFNEYQVMLIKMEASGDLSVIDFLSGMGFCLYAVDDKNSILYPVDKNKPYLLKYSDQTLNILCIKNKRPLSIVFFSHSPGLGGAERSLSDLIEGLCAEGVLCWCVLPEDGPLALRLKEAGCSLISLKDTDKLKWWWVKDKKTDAVSYIDTMDTLNDTLIPELKKIAPDIIISQTIVSPWGAVCADILGVPHVLSAREYGELDHIFDFEFGFDESMEAFYQASQAVFCVTRDVADTLFGDDKKNKCGIIYAGPAIKKEDIGKGTEKGIKTVNIGIFSSIHRNKGQIDLIKALPEIIRREKNIKVFIAGFINDEDYYEEILREIQLSGLQDHIELFEFTDNPYPLMNNMDIVVSCSAREALGRSLLEAVMLGKPVIYADAGGPKEIFTPDIHGLAYRSGDFAELAEKVLSTINNKNETEKRVIQAEEYVKERFSIENYAGRVLQRLMEIKGKKTRTGNSMLKLLTGRNIPSSFRCKMYYAGQGQDFSEERALLSREDISFGYFTAEFAMPCGGYEKFRFDPVENCPVELTIYDISVKNSEISGIECSNGLELSEHTWVFYHNDPQIFFQSSVKEKTAIVIRGEIKRVHAGPCIDILNSRLKHSNAVIAEKSSFLEQVKEKLAERERSESQLRLKSGQISTLLINTGSALRQISRPIDLKDGNFDYVFDLSGYGNNKRFRFAPFRGRWSRILVKRISSADGYDPKYLLPNEGIESNGLFCSDGYIEFRTFAPLIRFEFPYSPQRIYISINVELYSYSDTDRIFNIYDQELIETGRELQQSREDLESRGAECRRMEAQLRQREAELKRKISELRERDTELEHTRRELVSIYMSRFWKWTRPLRKLTKRIREFL